MPEGVTGSNNTTERENCGQRCEHQFAGGMQTVGLMAANALFHIYGHKHTKAQQMQFFVVKSFIQVSLHFPSAETQFSQR